MFKRYAIVRGRGIMADQVRRYLPSNYRVEGEAEDPAFPGDTLGHVVVIGGRDEAGWTLDGYVIPRLGSGLLGAREVGLDHPVFKQIPVQK